ncbi:MAG: hypothetical protein K0Q49_287 [Haloplasmataceae bacterium]|nr:hypothetical protein [Haloplasmataceae bacterium]
MELIVPVIILMIIPLIILIVVFLYKSLYRRHANHALNGEGSTLRYIEPFNFIVMLLLIVITIFSIVSYSEIKVGLKNLNNNGEINQLSFNINNRFSSLSDQIDELQAKINEMEERTKWIIEKSFEYDYNELSDDHQSIVVDIDFSLRTLENTSQIYLLIIDKEDVNQSQKLLIENNEFLSYTKKVELSLDKNYSIELLSENETIDQKEELFDIDFKTNLTNRIQFKVFAFKVQNEEKPSEFDITIDNNHYGIEVFKLSKISYNIYKGSTLVEQKDITNEVYGSGNTYLDIYKYHGNINFDYDESLLIELIVEDGTGKTTTIRSQYLYEERIY